MIEHKLQDVVDSSARPDDNTSIDRVIYRAELCTMLGVKTECVRRWLVAGKLPKPDVAISRKTAGWRLSTLRSAGIGLV